MSDLISYLVPLRDGLEVIVSPRVPTVIVPSVLEGRHDAPLALVLRPPEHHRAVEGRHLRRGILVVLIFLRLCEIIHLNFVLPSVPLSVSLSVNVTVTGCFIHG